MNKDNFTNINDESAFLYTYIAQRAMERHLSNTLNSLLLLRDMVIDLSINKTKYHHCLLMCRMMIDLNMNLTKQEEDILLASALCHIIPEEIRNCNLEQILIKDYHLNREVYEIVSLLHSREYVNEVTVQQCYDKIQENKLALLIAITDRGNAVEQLHVMNSWQVNRFIYDTRRYYFTMCIYAKEHYIDLLSPLSILLEKLRNLTDVSEVLLAKFESMEIALAQEILALQEENATIRGILKKLKDENN